MSENVTINAVAFKEGDTWVVQGIEFDIAAHANDVNELPGAFTRAVVENICIAQHLGLEPLKSIKPAPDKFKSMFDRAQTQVRSVTDWPVADISIPNMDIRLAQQA